MTCTVCQNFSWWWDINTCTISSLSFIYYLKKHHKWENKPLSNTYGNYYKNAYVLLLNHNPSLISCKHYLCIWYTGRTVISAAAAKSCQSCPTLCDSTVSSPPGSSVPGILQARILEWVAISFSRTVIINAIINVLTAH